jgi:nitrite reductase/ring-hydroxylating ferredoxin subunit
VRPPETGGVGVAAEANNRNVEVRVRDVVRIDSADVGNHKVGPIGTVARDEVMLRQESLQLAPEEDIDPTQQDRRHDEKRSAPAARSSSTVTRMDRAFTAVARAEDVPPGTLRAATLANEEIALAHCDGGFYAVQGHCLHLQGPLAEGRLEGCVLTCPWHGWQYDVRTGENEFDLAIQLRTYDVQVENGEVRVRVTTTM